MTRYQEFSRVKKKGVAKGGSYLVLSTLADPELPHHKAGIIATRKIGNAVTRNLLRRRVQAIVAKYSNQIDNQQGNRYIVTILRWRAPEATYAQLEKDWLKQANRLGILTPS